MKSSILISLFLLLTTNLIAQTTLEEYNYVRKGLKIQIDNGLDMKRGYIMQKTGVQTSYKNGLGQSFAIEFFYLISTSNSSNKIKAIIAAYKFRGNTPDYYCIPTFNSSETLWSSYWEECNKFNNEIKFLFSYGLGLLSAKQLN